jgi:transposase
MFLKCSVRRKDGKIHWSWSIVESRRVRGGGTVQRHVLYLGEINDSQQSAWQKSIEVFSEDEAGSQQMAFFPEDRIGEVTEAEQIHLKLQDLTLHRPRQWGACWLALELWRELGLEAFWRRKLPPSREHTPWDLVLTTLVIYRLLDPGSEWRLHRQWFEQSALGDLLGQDFRLVAADTLYRCHDLLLGHKAALLSHLQERWRDLFGAKFEVLLYDLTSTYFEADPPENNEGLRRFGYSRDKRSDCVQVVIALILTPEGFPIGYEVLAGNTSDKSTLGGMLQKIETQYGKAERTWIMDRGVPTEEILEEMRASLPPVRYLVGTPKGRLSKLEKDLAQQPWQEARPGVTVKLLPQGEELYVFAQSEARIDKERAMRRRRLKKLSQRLKELQARKITYQDLLMKLGAAKAEAGLCWGVIEITLPEAPAKAQKGKPVSFTFMLNRKRLRQMRQREGRYLLRSNLTESDPAVLWEHYITLTQIEEAFKNLKGDLRVRPIFHQKDQRIEAHIFVAFLAYCLHVTLSRRLHPLAPGLTARSALEKFAAISMLDVHLPTTDKRTLILTRYTQPEKEVQILLEKLKLELPPQPPPKITAPKAAATAS